MGRYACTIDFSTSTGPVLIERGVISTDVVNAVSFTCDETRIISGSMGGIVRIWNALFVRKRNAEALNTV